MQRKILVLPLVATIFVGCAATNAQHQSTWTRIPSTEFAPIPIEPIIPDPALIVIATPVPSHRVQIAVQAPTKPRSAPKPTKVVSVSTAQKYALSRIGAYQYSCLYQMWNKESHWNYLAENKSSGAYGIPQALPGSKMATVGSDWRTNPITQVKWGLGYVKGRYGSACNAWSFWQTHRWY